MNDINKVIFSDFYFNNRWLSDFDAEIGGSTPTLPSISALPEKEIGTQQVMGVDGQLVTSVRFLPRTFSLPIVLNDLSRLRELANWLGAIEATDFHFRGDNVKIKCMVEGAVDVAKLFGSLGTADIKFIAHGVYYEAIDDITHVFNSPVVAQVINFHNQGTSPSKPMLRVYGTGVVKIQLNGEEFTLDGITGGYVDMDCAKQTVFNSTGNKYHIFKGKFKNLSLKPDYNDLKLVSGTVTKIEVQCKSRWI